MPNWVFIALGDWVFKRLHIAERNQNFSSFRTEHDLYLVLILAAEFQSSFYTVCLFVLPLSLQLHPVFWAESAQKKILFQCEYKVFSVILPQIKEVLFSDQCGCHSLFLECLEVKSTNNLLLESILIKEFIFSLIAKRERCKIRWNIVLWVLTRTNFRWRVKLRCVVYYLT